VPAEDYGQHKADAWDGFYRASPAACRRWQLQALRELSELE
jgi:phosphorylase kinase alpha/beta subunit